VQWAFCSRVLHELIAVRDRDLNGLHVSTRVTK